MSKDELNEAFTAKLKRGIFKPVARHVRGDQATAEDQLQDAIAQTWEMYHRYATTKRRVLPDALLVRYCRWRATDLNHSFVPAGCMRRQDVLDPRAYLSGQVEVLRIDGIFDSCAEGDCGLQLGYAEASMPNPQRVMNSAIDLQDWLERLDAKDYGLMVGRFCGYSYRELGEELGMETGKAWMRARKLGAELARRARIGLSE